MITTEESLGDMELAEFMVRCSVLDGFPLFCERTMRNASGDPLKVMDFQMEWVEAFMRQPRSLIEAPRQHGKTTILAEAYPIWRCFFMEDYDFLVVSHRMEHSTKILQSIKQFIANSELLHERLVPKTRHRSIWRRTILRTKTNCTVSANPNTHAICGGTFNDVLCDEISLYQDHDVYFKDIIPTVGTRQGHIMNIGTPKTGVDLLAKIKELNDQKGGYFYKKYRAFDSDGRKLWPQGYNDEEWQKIKQSMSSLDFMREYMCEIVDSQTQAFPTTSVVACYDPTSYFEQSPVETAQYYGASDLARSPDGDFNVHTIVRRDSQGFVRLAYMDRTKGMDVDSRALRIANVYKTWKPLNYFADESLDGKAVIDECMKTYHMPIRGFVFTPENRYAILTNLVKLIERNRLRIPSKEGDFYTAEMVQRLTKELSDMVRDVTPQGQPTYKCIGKHDDTVMSLALACWAIGDMNETVGISDYVVCGGPESQKKDETTGLGAFFV